MNDRMTTFDLLHAALRDLGQALQLRNRVNTKIHQLEGAGTAAATPYWKPSPHGGDPRLYLIYPTPPGGGRRRQEYVGTSALRQLSALDRVARHRHAQELRQALAAIDRELQAIRQSAAAAAAGIERLLQHHGRTCADDDSATRSGAGSSSDERQLTISSRGA